MSTPPQAGRRMQRGQNPFQGGLLGIALVALATLAVSLTIGLLCLFALAVTT